MGIHSDSIYKDTQREVEAKKVDTEQVVGKDAEGNIFIKVEDTADGGKLTIYDETGTKQGEIYIDEHDWLSLNAVNNYIAFKQGGSRKARVLLDRVYLDSPLDCGDEEIRNPRKIFGFYSHDSAPGVDERDLVLASPAWDPDGDGNGELVMYDGTAWQEVVDLPNYT